MITIIVWRDPVKAKKKILIKMHKTSVTSFIGNTIHTLIHPRIVDAALTSCPLLRGISFPLYNNYIHFQPDQPSRLKLKKMVGFLFLSCLQDAGVGGSGGGSEFLMTAMFVLLFVLLYVWSWGCGGHCLPGTF